MVGHSPDKGIILVQFQLGLSYKGMGENKDIPIEGGVGIEKGIYTP